jgi:hypothetical protein
LTGGVLMGSHYRGVDHDPVEIRFLKPVEDGLPASLFRPVIEAVVDRIIFAEAVRQVRPGRSGTSDPNHRVDEPAVIFSISAWGARLARKQRLNTPVLLVRNFVASSHR